MTMVYDLMTLDEVCEYLRISRSTLAGMIKMEKFPVIQLGEKNPRVKFEHLQKWLDEQTTKIMEEMKSE